MRLRDFPLPKWRNIRKLFPLSSLLSKDRSKRAIASEEDTYWTKTWQAYKDSKKDIWSLNYSGADVPESFKASCKNKLSSKVSGEASEEYGNFLTYCSRSTLISDLLKDSKRTILSTKDGAGTQDWKDAWTRYIEANKEKTNDDVWTVSNFSDKKTKQNEDAPDDFRNSCDAKLGSSDISNTTLFDQVKDWCTKA